jgi:hypothetical protein
LGISLKQPDNLFDLCTILADSYCVSILCFSGCQGFPAIVPFLSTLGVSLLSILQGYAPGFRA